MRTHRTLTVSSALVSAVLVGCQLPPPAPIIHQPVTARASPAGPPVANGAIYQAAGSYRPMFEDVRARNVGDTLTVLISESNVANKKGSSEVKRTGDATATVGTMNLVPGRQLQGLSASGSSSNTFDGSGQSASSNDFTGTITVTVTEVFPNGNLMVSGEKQIAMSEGTEYIRFSGVVNPRLITVSNTVTSSQVADARMEYKANGYLDEARIMGWLARFFLTILPF